MPEKSNVSSAYARRIGRNTDVSQCAYIKKAVNANAYGYGQVEPNHLSAQATKEIYAQLPMGKDIDILENGQFAKYDYANNEVNFTGKGEWMLVYNEVKVYDSRETDADFAMIRDNYVGTVTSAEPSYIEDQAQAVCPRLYKTHVGDHYTTNFINATTPAVGDLLAPDENGILSTTAYTETDVPNGTPLWQVVKVYIMPDLQPGVKLIRIA